MIFQVSSLIITMKGNFLKTSSDWNVGVADAFLSNRNFEIQGQYNLLLKENILFSNDNTIMA